MGKQLFQEVCSSPTRTAALGLSDMVVVSEFDDSESIESTYHVVHKSYFSKSKNVCPFCNSTQTAETKIRQRKYKDILRSSSGEDKVIDLFFHQRFFRCKECKRIFCEKIEFAEDGCRFTNRLSDILAEGTLTRTYKSVCDGYGVPASKTSVGIIMRRRMRIKATAMPPLIAPDALAIVIVEYFSSRYPIILGVYNNEIRLIDILVESSESTYSVFFNTIYNRDRVKCIYIDPDEQLHYAAVSYFPDAQIMISGECIERYIRDAFKGIVKRDGARSFIHHRYHTFCKQSNILSDNEYKQIENVLKKRPRLAAGYNAYQEIVNVIGDNKTRWSLQQLQGWLDDLPTYIEDAKEKYQFADDIDRLEEFDILYDVLECYEPLIEQYLSSDQVLPANYSSAIRGIVDALEQMPYCIYDVLRARMLLNVEQDTMILDDKEYRIGIFADKLTARMNDITAQIRKQKENDE